MNYTFRVDCWEKVPIKCTDCFAYDMKVKERATKYNGWGWDDYGEDSSDDNCSCDELPEVLKGWAVYTTDSLDCPEKATFTLVIGKNIETPMYAFDAEDYQQYMGKRVHIVDGQKQVVLSAVTDFQTLDFCFTTNDSDVEIFHKVDLPFVALESDVSYCQSVYNTEGKTITPLELRKQIQKIKGMEKRSEAILEHIRETIELCRNRAIARAHSKLFDCQTTKYSPENLNDTIRTRIMNRIIYTMVNASIYRNLTLVLDKKENPHMGRK